MGDVKTMRDADIASDHHLALNNSRTRAEKVKGQNVYTQENKRLENCLTNSPDTKQSKSIEDFESIDAEAFNLFHFALSARDV
ncbi:unnamed protein product [Schistosoma margrebowiei]|uniref:Uncharacterized protein n=1 Tax=Schistosoma margrebowiei TaxID=48269 RepID=A0A183MVP5_9TREM|nr:unnamed protein product [Schistosoma margrebowiei]